MLLSWRLVKWRRQNSHDRQTWIKNGNLKRKKEILNMIQKLNSASRDYETITVNLMTSPPPPQAQWTKPWISNLVVTTVEGLVAARVARDPHHREVLQPAVVVAANGQLHLPQGLKHKSLHSLCTSLTDLMDDSKKLSCGSGSSSRKIVKNYQITSFFCPS